MSLTTILNVAPAAGVIVMVAAPLVWAILTQHRDQQLPVADRAGTRPLHPHRTRPPRRSYTHVVGRA